MDSVDHNLNTIVNLCGALAGRRGQGAVSGERTTCNKTPVDVVRVRIEAFPVLRGPEYQY